MFKYFLTTFTQDEKHPLVLDLNNFILFQKTLQLGSYTFLLSYVRKGFCDGRVFISTLQYLSY